MNSAPRWPAQRLFALIERFNDAFFHAIPNLIALWVGLGTRARFAILLLAVTRVVAIFHLDDFVDVLLMIVNLPTPDQVS